MKLLSTDDYVKFECIGGECPLTCCGGGWNIVVDEKSAEYYKSVEGEFGDELRSGMIERNGTVIFKLKENMECIFLNENKLCRIYRELGGEHTLCETCRRFPRGMYDVGDVMVCFLDNACPEVNRMLMHRTDPISTLYDDSDNNDKSVSEYEIQVVRLAMRIMSVGIHLLQDREISIKDRMLLLLFYVNSIQEGINASEDISEIIQLFSDKNTYITFLDGIDGIDDYSEKLKAFKIVLGIILSDSVYHPMWQMCHDLLGRINDNGFGNQEMVNEAFARFDSGYLSIELEQLIVHRFFAVFLQGLGDFDFMKKLSREYILLAAYISYIALSEAGREEGSCKEDDKALFYSVCSRIEHSKKQKAQFESEIEKNQLDKLEVLIKLV